MENEPHGAELRTLPAKAKPPRQPEHAGVLLQNLGHELGDPAIAAMGDQPGEQRRAEAQALEVGAHE